MTDWVIPVFQHGGSFVKDNKGELLYINGNVKRFPPLDLDLVNYFDLKKMFEELGYHAYKKMYWYDPTAPSYEAGLHPIYGDKEIREMCDKKREDRETDELCLFFDHPIMEDVDFEDSDDTDEHSEAEVLSDEPISDNDSYDSYESAEDEAYKPPPPGFEDDTNDSYDSFEDEELMKKTKRKGGNRDKKGKKKAVGKKDNARKKGGPKQTTRPNDKYGPNITVGPTPTARPSPTTGRSEFGVGPGIAEEGDDIFSDESDGLGFESEGFDTPQSSDNEGDDFDWPQFNEEADFGDVQLQLNMEFATLDQFKHALKDYTIAEGRRIFYVKNDNRRVRCKCASGEEKAMIAKAKFKAKCKAKRKETDAAEVDNSGENGTAIVPSSDDNECPWLIYCAWNSARGCYQIKTYEPKHTCAREFGSNMADQKWVADKLEKRLLTQPHMTHGEAFDHIKIDFNVVCSDKMIYRALRVARERYVGNERAQYGKLRDYLTEIHRSNPSSTALLETTPTIPGSPPLFSKLYICLEGCKRGFKAGCRPLIGLDGCHLKGYYGGQLLSAVAQDANNHFYVIAYAVVDSETKQSWKWFLQLLQEDIGNCSTEEWNFISDQQKGLLPALHEVMPNAHHRNCVRHIWKNFIGKFKDKQLKNIVWACAKSSTDAEFQHHMQRLKRMNEEAWAYLAKFQPSCWTKSYFSHWPKLDNVTNNMSEVWNAKINHYRGKPILTMLEELRCYLMRRMVKHKKILSTYTGVLAPVQQRKLEDLMKDTKFWTAQWTGDNDRNVFEVQTHSKKVGVNLGRHTCTCNMWQLTGIPCVHALAAIQKRCDRPELYVHPWLKMDAFRATYEHVMKPVNSEEYWVKTGLLSPEPPIIRRPAGRPTKKKRKADPVEDVRDGTKGRRTFKVTCQKCGESGHNAKTCKGPPRPKPPPKNKGKKKGNGNGSTIAAGSQEEVQVTLSAPQPQPQEQTTNSSNQVASTTSFRPPRPKQQILRPHVAPVTAPTPPMKLVSAPRPLPPPTLTPPPTAPFAPVPRSLHPNQIPRISPETVAATSSGTAARIFKFMPTPGLNLQKKK
ncbi:uncharacterized protein [Arachis hypogaea]|uniref:uncharacterized protein isoform X2 n=1 Tax=Arachis hypogaea TaxID=3818 RepID=UPI000DECC557|nr:uncharacterized protein LOC112744225 isoform X2 [Arachis hypogaea]